MPKFTRKDFLEVLFQDYFRKREGFIIVQSSRSLDQKSSVRYFPNMEILAKEPYQADQQVFFGVCPHENMKPDKSNIQYVVALWVGLDLGPEGFSGRQSHFFGQAQAAKAIRSFPLPPSIIVESGWGVHLYWLLREVTPVRDRKNLEALLTRINGYFQCKKDIGIDSMLRLPDTVNAKVATHLAECRIKYINSDFRYDLDDIARINVAAVGSLSSSAVFPRNFSESASDVSGVAQENAQGELVSPSLNSGAVQDINEDASREVRISNVPEPLEPLAAVARPREMTARNPASTSPAEPDFEPVPYESVRSKPKGAPHPQLADVLPEDVLERVADKLADRVAEKLGKKLVDEIVEKVVMRLILPG